MNTTTTKRKLLYVIILLILTSVTIYALPKSLGSFVQVVTRQDSASAAKYDVVITIPNEFNMISDNNHYSHSFLTKDEMKPFDFKVTNNGEVDVLCTPYINDTIAHLIYVDGETVAEFVVLAGETITFQLLIVAIDFDAGVTQTEFFVDVQQWKGG